MPVDLFSIPTPAVDRYHNVVKRVGTILLLAIFAGPAAGQHGSPKKDRYGLSLGLGTIYVRQVYKDIDNRSIPIPVISYRGPRLRIEGTGASYKIFQWMMLSGKLLTLYRTTGYDPEDSPFLTGMQEREDTVEIGGELGVFLPYGFQLKTRLFIDSLDRHKGELVDISLSKFFGSDRWILTPSIGLLYQDQSGNDYYYGVRPNEATSVRPSYRANSSLSPHIGGMIRYNFNKQWGFMTIINIEFLSSEKQNSPIVDKNERLFSLFGITYKFPKNQNT